MGECVTLELDEDHIARWRAAAQRECRTLEDMLTLELRLRMYGCLQVRGTPRATDEDVKKRGRTPRMVTQEMRHEVYKACAGKCAYCGREVNSFSFQVDHIVPVSKGGTNEPANLIGACRACNRAKRAKTVEEFKRVFAA